MVQFLGVGSQGLVRQFLTRKTNLGQYDLVYAAGLFDYLNSGVASALTRHMWDIVRPSGLMLIPNFMVGTRDRGYMESFMDRHLIYRTETDMWELLSVLPKNEVDECEMFEDDVDTITYLLVAKS
jgi:extracellular factor (EF) 3-hydroxypalmitic acid methyl ester biosynthesis protein